MLSILRAFEDDTADLTLSELADRSELPKSTLHRVAGQMVEEGLLQKTNYGYRLGITLFELGGLVPGPRRLREAALPLIEALFEATHQTIHFGVLDGDEVLYLERIMGHKSVNAPTRTGGRLPAYCTGLGKALLAFMPPETVATVLSGELKAFTRNTITSQARLCECLQEVRKARVAFDREERTLGVACVAGPVVNRAGHSVAAISVTTRPDKSSLDRLVPAVRATAIALSRAVQTRPDRHWAIDTQLLLEE